MCKYGMTQVEAEHYIKQLRRKGVALSLPKEELKKFQKVYDALDHELAVGLPEFMDYALSGGTNQMNPKTRKLAIRKCRESSLHLEFITAVHNGDADTLASLCPKLRKLYNQAVRDILAVDEAMVTFAKLYAEKAGYKKELLDKSHSLETFVPVYDALEGVLNQLENQKAEIWLSKEDE